MSTTEIVVLVLLALLGGAAVAALALAWHRGVFRDRFGREYENLVAASSGWLDADRRRGEHRELRMVPLPLEIEPLSERRRAMYVEQWRAVQATFLVEPARALTEADGLVARAMAERGYPVLDFEQRAAELAVRHPDVVAHYRAGHRVQLLNERGEADREQLCEAMLHYRRLFGALTRQAVHDRSA